FRHERRRLGEMVDDVDLQLRKTLAQPRGVEVANILRERQQDEQAAHSDSVFGNPIPENVIPDVAGMQCLSSPLEHISAFTRVFNAPCPAMTAGKPQPTSNTFFSVLCMQGPTPFASTM